MPAAPDFQDPPPVPNYLPYFVNSDPFAEVTGIMPPQTFSVLVTDPNPNDLLYVRWVSDYPPFTQAGTKLLVTPTSMPGPSPGDPPIMVGTPQGSPTTEIRFELSAMASRTCRTDLMPGDHKLVLIVSDRPFSSTDQFNSAYRYNVAAGTTPIMQGWSVTCP